MVEHIVKRLDLKPHPEGGYYRETYRSKGSIPKNVIPEDFSGNRNYSTCIYFLLTSGNFSAFHRIKQDEIWHFYDGAAIRLHMISPQGDYSSQLVGRNFEAGELPQFVVPAGYLFASEVAKDNSYALAGCTVAPGFDFDDFEMPSRDQLLNHYPQHSEVITRLTR